MGQSRSRGCDRKPCKDDRNMQLSNADSILLVFSVKMQCLAVLFAALIAAVSALGKCKYTHDTHEMQYLYEPVREKTNYLKFRPGLTQTGLQSHRSSLEA